MKKIFLTFLVVAGLLVFSVPAQSTIVSFGLDTEFSGATPPQSATLPWLTAEFNDNGGTGSVTLTLGAPNLTGTEFVSVWDFNFDPSLNPASLAISPQSGEALTANISKATNNFKADGDGYFDIEFTWGNGVFTDGETAVFLLTLAGISANSFNFQSVMLPSETPGPWHTAAHVQGIGTDGQASGWIGDSGENTPPPIPEPATMLLLGSGLIGLAGLGRKKFRKS